MMNKNEDIENNEDVEVVDPEEEEVEEEEEEEASVAGGGEDQEGGASDAEESDAEASEADEEEPDASEAEASDPEVSEAEVSDPEASEAEASDQEAPASGSDDDEESGTKKTKTKKTKNTKTKNSKNVSSISGVNMLPTAKPKSQTGKSAPPIIASDDDDDEYEEDEDDEFYLQKFDRELRDNFITDYHPESKAHNYEEVKALARVSRDGRGIINDPLHKTIPFLTKYEMTRVVGQRAKQLDNGAKPFVRVPPNIIDGYHIALLELEQKKIPFIIKRPYPNGGVEYWHVNDLELL